MTREEEIRARCEAEAKNLQRNPLVMTSGPRIEKVLEEDVPYILDENARLQKLYNQQGGMYFEACEDRRTMGEEIRRLGVVSRRLSRRLVKQEEHTYKARQQRDAAKAEVARLQRDNEALRNAGTFDPLEMAKIAIAVQANAQLQAMLEAAETAIAQIEDWIEVAEPHKGVVKIIADYKARKERESKNE